MQCDEKICTESDLCEGIPIVSGGLDAVCETFGSGVLINGAIRDQGGQAGEISICIDSYKSDPRSIFGCHVVPNCWLLWGGTTGGRVMCWFEQKFGEYEMSEELKRGKDHSVY